MNRASRALQVRPLAAVVAAVAVLSLLREDDDRGDAAVARPATRCPTNGYAGVIVHEPPATTALPFDTDELLDQLGVPDARDGAIARPTQVRAQRDEPDAQRRGAGRDKPRDWLSGGEEEKEGTDSRKAETGDRTMRRSGRGWLAENMKIVSALDAPRLPMEPSFAGADLPGGSDDGFLLDPGTDRDEALGFEPAYLDIGRQPELALPPPEPVAPVVRPAPANADSAWDTETVPPAGADTKAHEPASQRGDWFRRR